MFKFIMSLLKRKGEVSMGKHKVDYIRNCVEEKVGHPVPDLQYKKALEMSYSKNCRSMQDRINAVARCL
jgi:hypothetical protein